MSHEHITPPPPPLPPSTEMPIDATAPIEEGAVRPSGGRMLVVRDGTVLPPVCLATGKGGDLVTMRGTLSWAPPWLWAVFFISTFLGMVIEQTELIFIAPILYFFLRKVVHITYYLEHAYAGRRRGNIALFWCLVIVSVVGMIVSMILLTEGQGIPLLLSL